MAAGIDPRAVAIVAAAINPDHAAAPAAEQGRDIHDARELLQLARRQGRRRREREAELRAELAQLLARKVAA